MKIVFKLFSACALLASPFVFAGGDLPSEGYPPGWNCRLKFKAQGKVCVDANFFHLIGPGEIECVAPNGDKEDMNVKVRVTGAASPQALALMEGKRRTHLHLKVKGQVGAPASLAQPEILLGDYELDQRANQLRLVATSAPLALTGVFETQGRGGEDVRLLALEARHDDFVESWRKECVGAAVGVEEGVDYEDTGK